MGMVRFSFRSIRRTVIHDLAQWILGYITVPQRIIFLWQIEFVQSWDYR